MKKLKFDVFALVSPLEKCVPLYPDAQTRTPQPVNYAIRLANSIRQDCFILPQVELLGKQMTEGPSPVRMLHFHQYEVPDYAIRKIISELDSEDQTAIRAYLWNAGTLYYDQGNRKWIELDPPFTDEAERAFQRVFALLEQLDLLRFRTAQGVQDGGTAM